jgi:hypothetical protein
VDPVPDPLLLRKSDKLGIEPGSLDPYPGTLSTRQQRRSGNHSMILKITDIYKTPVLLILLHESQSER